MLALALWPLSRDRPFDGTEQLRGLDEASPQGHSGGGSVIAELVPVEVYHVLGHADGVLLYFL